MTKKRTAWRKYKRFKTFELKSKYNEISQKNRESILNNERKYEGKIINSNNLGKFYRHANRKFCSKTGIGAIRLDNGFLGTNEVDQAEAFNKYFSSVFTLDNQILPNFEPRTDRILGNITFNPTIVCKILKGLKQDSSPGPDNIPPIFLKMMADELASPLSYLFEHFLLMVMFLAYGVLLILFLFIKRMTRPLLAITDQSPLLHPAVKSWKKSYMTK